MWARFRRSGAIAHQPHRSGSAILQLIERTAGDGRGHSRRHHRFAAVGKVHGALAVNHVESLIGVVTMHVVSVAGFGINVHPGVKTVGIEYDLAFAFTRLLDHVDDFDRHNSSSTRICAKVYLTDQAVKFRDGEDSHSKPICDNFSTNELTY